MHWTHESSVPIVGAMAVLGVAWARATQWRLSCALWCAGLAAFSLMYAPQGLLTQITQSTSADESQVSLLVSATTLGLAVSVLPWAWVSDRIGRRASMRTAAAGAAVTAVAVPWLPSFQMLLAGRLLQGIALGGIAALALALLHETAAPDRTAALAGSYIAATSLGGLAGRMVVVPVADHLGWRVSLAVLGGIVAVLMSALIALLPRARPVTRTSMPTRTTADHLRDRRMVALFGVGGLLVGGMVAVFNYLPFRLEAPPYALPPAVVSLVFLAYLGGTIGSRAAGWLTRRFGDTAVLITACALLSLGAAVTVVESIAAIIAGVVILTTGLFIGHAVASHQVAARAEHGRAQAGALYNISFYAGSSLFGWLGGLAWLSGGWTAVTILVAALGAVALLLAAGARTAT